MADPQIELLKSGLSALVSILSLSLGWFVGNRITHNWTIRQKKRELDLSVISEVYKLYGEFFAVWKLWNYYISDIKEHDFLKDIRLELLKRATAAEAGMEAVFVRVASEKYLTHEQIACLGKYRQAYQALRQAIKKNKKLDWNNSKHPDYIALKEGATKLSWLINIGDNKKQILKPSAEIASESLLKITSNEWEKYSTAV